ncbi:MAG: hypothetical protein H7289_14805, partial [Mucilaginibacter sp.]|nr:hypothetical protein [Mucilaginibacter sp.]
MKIMLPLIFILLSFFASSQTVNISGRVYYDVNGNHVFDGVDSVLGSQTVSAFKQGGFDTAVTDNAGLYHMVLETGSYFFRLDNNQTIQDFSLVAPQRTYSSPTTDIVDFPLIKTYSITGIYCNIQSTDNAMVPPSGGNFTYSLNYNYTGSLHSMPATVTIDYNPALTFITASPEPNVISNSKLQWNFTSVKSFNNDSIALTLHFPAAGDTVSGYSLSPKMIPGVATNPDYISLNEYPYAVYREFPEAEPTGVTNGIKWLRHFDNPLNDNQQYDDDCLSIDTTQDGKGYFIAGHRNNKPTDTYSPNSNPFIAKLNKDGLSVWEKYVDSSGGQRLFDAMTAIKHTADGGCLVLGTNILVASSQGSGNIDGPFVVKFDALGNLVWSKSIHGSAVEDFGNDMTVMPDGSCLITGRTKSHDGDFANNNSDFTNYNLFVTKLSPTGNIVFTKVYGGSESDAGKKIVPLTNSTFLLLGSTESNDGDVTGAHIHNSHYVQDSYLSDTSEAWVLNINASGNILWSKCYGGSKSSFITGAAQNNGGILLTGGTNSKDGDLPYYPEEMTSLWALQISMTGNILWSKPYKLYKGYQDSNYIGSPIGFNYNNNFGSSLHKTKDGNFVLGGTITDKYGTIKSKHGDADFMLMKINTTGDIVWQKAIGGTRYDQLNDIQVDN